ncbi:MAG: trypsin-like peptidase domain-containing protein [Phycisphaerales bacterium]
MRKITSYGPAIVLLMATLLALFVVPSVVERYSYAQQNAKISLARSVLAQDDILRRIDRSVSAIADATEPSVVHIESRTESSASSLSPSYSTGAGWVFDAQGHIVTNAHVVQSATDVSVEFFDGNVVLGKVIGVDPYTDIAVISTGAHSKSFAARRAIDRLPRTGEQVYAFGSPFGFKFSMSKGIISGLGREAGGSNVPGGYTNYIQTDAAVNPGNSGGPLVNSDGHVIGMNVAIATAKSVGRSPEDSGSDSAGISFAIPLGTIEPIVAQIIKYGKVSRGYLGISYANQAQDHVNIPLDDGTTLTGIRVTEVVPDGPSDQGGIKPGDILVRIQGSPILNDEGLKSLVTSSRSGDPISVRVYRENRFLDLTIVLGKLQDGVLAARIAEPIMVQLGMAVVSSPKGVEVSSVWTGLPADVAGFVVGDQIITANNKPVENFAHFFVLVADEGILTGKPVTFRVIGRDNQTRDIMVHLKW